MQRASLCDQQWLGARVCHGGTKVASSWCQSGAKMAPLGHMVVPRWHQCSFGARVVPKWHLEGTRAIMPCKLEAQLLRNFQISIEVAWWAGCFTLFIGFSTHNPS